MFEPVFTLGGIGDPIKVLQHYEESWNDGRINDAAHEFGEPDEDEFNILQSKSISLCISASKSWSKGLYKKAIKDVVLVQKYFGLLHELGEVFDNCLEYFEWEDYIDHANSNHSARLECGLHGALREKARTLFLANLYALSEDWKSAIQLYEYVSVNWEYEFGGFEWWRSRSDIGGKVFQLKRKHGISTGEAMTMLSKERDRRDMSNNWDPIDLFACLNLGMVCLQQKRNKKINHAISADCFDQAVDLINHLTHIEFFPPDEELDVFIHAKFNLAWLVLNGVGVTRDEEKAQQLYMEIYPTYPKAAFNLGAMYFKGLGVSRSYEKATEYFEYAAEHDVPGAKTVLEQIKGYLSAGNASRSGKIKNTYGLCVPEVEFSGELGKMSQGKLLTTIVDRIYKSTTDEDYKHALNQLRELSNSSVPVVEMNVCFNMGYLHLYGLGVDKDRKNAIYYFDKAAALGSVKAKFNLGLIYSKIKSIRFPSYAYYCFGLAAAGGLNEALKQMDKLEPELAPEDIRRAQECMTNDGKQFLSASEL